MVKSWNAVFLGTLLLAACGPSGDNKPPLQQQRDTMEKAKNLDALQQQEAEKLRQEAEKQAQ